MPLISLPRVLTALKKVARKVPPIAWVILIALVTFWLFGACGQWHEGYEPVPDKTQKNIIKWCGEQQKTWDSVKAGYGTKNGKYIWAKHKESDLKVTCEKAFTEFGKQMRDQGLDRGRGKSTAELEAVCKKGVCPIAGLRDTHPCMNSDKTKCCVTAKGTRCTSMDGQQSTVYKMNGNRIHTVSRVMGTTGDCPPGTTGEYPGKGDGRGCAMLASGVNDYNKWKQSKIDSTRAQTAAKNSGGSSGSSSGGGSCCPSGTKQMDGQCCKTRSNDSVEETIGCSSMPNPCPVAAANAAPTAPQCQKCPDGYEERNKSCCPNGKWEKGDNEAMGIEGCGAETKPLQC